MARATDPVCGMSVETGTAAGQSQFEGRSYYFCSLECKRQFDADPIRFAGTTRPIVADRAEPPPLERHEPPRTKAGGIVAPKFGSAGSGGAEYERLPEAHDERPDSS